VSDFTRAILLILFSAIASTAFAAGTVTVAWDPVTNPNVRGYKVHYGPGAGNYTASVDVGNITTAPVNNLTEGATYHFAVAAYDASHTEGLLSTDVGAIVKYTVPVAAFTASVVSGPAPLALNFTSSSTGTITSYSWNFGDGTTSTSASPAKVYSNAGTFTVTLTVTGPGGSNTSTKSNYITVTAGGGDTTPPSAPGTPTATPIGSTAIGLSWGAASDNVGVTSYRVERCQGASCATFLQIATPVGTAYNDSGLAAGTIYRYRVRAADAAGNLGAYSGITQASTAGGGGDTTPPSAPGSLSAVATATTAVRLTWTAATDNVKVTAYKVERCTGASCATFVQVGAPTGTTYSDSVMPATTYRYRVRATDAAGNLGPYTAIVSVTTP
jgi:PKD repeat protein